MGLEDQLLGVVIQHEQQALEEQMRALIVDVNLNTKVLAAVWTREQAFCVPR